MSPAPECSCNEKVNILFEPFWLWQFARSWILENGSDENYSRFVKSLQNWMSSVQQESFREETLIFILLLIDSKVTRKTNPSFAQDIYIEALQNHLFPASASWLAGNRAAKETQKALVNWAETHQAIIKEKRVLFSFLYFMSQIQILPIPDRLRLLSYYYIKIDKNNLTPYFLFIVKRMLSEIRDIKSIISSIEYLEGCEFMGIEIAHELAELSINIIVKYFDDKEKENQSEQSNKIKPVFIAIISCLKRISKNKKFDKSPSPWRRFYFREWLLFEFCRTLMEFEGLSQGLDFLMNENWFYPKKLIVSHPLVAYIVTIK